MRNAWGIFGIALGLCIGGVYTIHTQQSISPAVVIEIRYETSDVAQLFYDVGHGIIEADSARQAVAVSGGYSTLRFPVPMNAIRGLRFDPLTHAGTFTIRRAYIEDSHGGIVHQFELRDMLSGWQIGSRIDTGSEVRFSTIPGAVDPAITLDLKDAVTPSPYMREVPLLFLQLLIAALISTLATFLYVRAQRSEGVQRLLERLARSLSDPEFIVFDRFAIGCYLAAGIAFVGLAAGGFHGSSISLLSAGHSADASVGRPLVGTAKGIRSDEWLFHTPAILNQVYRAQPFEGSSSEPGPDYASLLANIPVRHFTTIFRPQFWGFFFLPPSYAFSFYWQFKGLLLLTGVFTLLILLTHSSRIAAFGALWYFVGPSTQWTYSWASLLPEMVGLFCLTICATFYIAVGTRPWLRVAAAGVCISSAVNFAMCAYVPHQIPLIWLGVFLTAWWIMARWKSIFTRDAALARGATLFAAWAIVGIVMLIFYVDAKQAILALAGTTYPGHRSSPGGGLSLRILFSHFFPYWQNESRLPTGFSNICEDAGFLWLAPATLFCVRRFGEGQRQKKLGFLFLFLFAIFIFAWLTLPVPLRIGRALLLDRSGINRSFHALGLANICLVSLCLSFPRSLNEGRRRIRETLSIGAAVFASAWPILFFTNKVNTDFLSLPELAIAVSYVTILVIAVIESRFRLLAASIVFPQLIFFTFVNPLDRGLRAVESTPLFEFVRSHPEVLRQRWIVYSPSVVDPGLFSAVGCDVITGLKYVPDFKLLRAFDPGGKYRNVYNQSGFLLAEPGYGLNEARFEGVISETRWTVNPLDPALPKAGVRYAAFAQPPPAEVARRMKQVGSGPISGFVLYELPSGL